MNRRAWLNDRASDQGRGIDESLVAESVRTIAERLTAEMEVSFAKALVGEQTSEHVCIGALGSGLAIDTIRQAMRHLEEPSRFAPMSWPIPFQPWAVPEAYRSLQYVPTDDELPLIRDHNLCDMTIAELEAYLDTVLDTRGDVR